MRRRRRLATRCVPSISSLAFPDFMAVTTSRHGLVCAAATVEYLNTRVPIRCALQGCDALAAQAPKGTDPDLARMHAELTREDLLEWVEDREPLPVKMLD